MDKKILIDAGILIGKTVMESEKMRKFLCGEYEDGMKKDIKFNIM